MVGRSVGTVSCYNNDSICRDTDLKIRCGASGAEVATRQLRRKRRTHQQHVEQGTQWSARGVNGEFREDMR